MRVDTGYFRSWLDRNATAGRGGCDGRGCEGARGGGRREGVDNPARLNPEGRTTLSVRWAILSLWLGPSRSLGKRREACSD